MAAIAEEAEQRPPRGEAGAGGRDGGGDEHDSDGDNSRYDKQHYWDERFKNEEGYEWLCSFEHVRHLLDEEFPACEPRWRDARILVLGCGNSPFSLELHEKPATETSHLVTLAVSSSTKCGRNMQHRTRRSNGLWQMSVLSANNSRKVVLTL